MAVGITQGCCFMVRAGPCRCVNQSRFGIQVRWYECASNLYHAIGVPWTSWTEVENQICTPRSGRRLPPAPSWRPLPRPSYASALRCHFLHFKLALWLFTPLLNRAAVVDNDLNPRSKARRSHYSRYLHPLKVPWGTANDLCDS
jgi:hypothetical protein